MKSLIYHTLTILLLSALSLPLHGQLQKTERFVPKDFLGERVFESATQGENLIIYFNTSEGILSYDGEDFKEVNIPSKPLEINEIQFFQNALYIATEKEILQYFPENDSISTIANKQVKQFKTFNNQLWLITDSELLLWENKSLKQVFESANNEKFQCFNINSNTTTIGHNKGITLLNKGTQVATFASYLNPKKILSLDSTTYILSSDAVFDLNKTKVVRNFKNGTDIIDFFVDDFGKIWFLENENKLKVNDRMKSVPLYYSDDKKSITGTSLFSDAESNLWILGPNSLFKITQNNPFTKLFVENAKNVYVGKNSNLIIKPTEILKYDLITDNSRIKIPRSNLPLQYNFAFATDEEWIITLNQSIYKLDKSSETLSLVKEMNRYFPITKLNEREYLAKDDTDNLYIVDANFAPIRKIDEIKSVRKLLFGNGETFVISKANSVSTLDAQGAIINKLSLTDSINIENLVPAVEGFWYYNANEIFKINSTGAIENVRTDRALNIGKPVILNIFDDGGENLWVSTKNNLFRFPIVEKKGKTILQKPVRYNTTDFIFSTFFKSVKKDGLELLWFINENGISIYNPLQEIPNLTAPYIKVEQAFAYTLDDFNNPTDTVYLNEDNKKISTNSIVVIEPKVINHFNSSKSEVGYRNLSINQSERRISSGEKIILTDLSYGLNTIKLKGYNYTGIESGNEVNINVFVTPPVWRQNWFYISGILSVLLLGFVGYRTVISIKNSRARELEDELHKGLEDLEKKSHLQVLKAERLKQLNELITSQKSELEKKNKQIESQKYELSLTNQQIKKQKDLLEETSSKLTSSINYAKRIQNALMSTEVEIKKAFLESFVYFLPRDVVSGDFFWFNKVENDKGEELLILAAVDCTGHGVPGAIVSVVGMNLLNNITKQKKIYDPGQILTEMNNDIISDLRQDETQVNDGMDMTLVTYNTATKQLYFAGAKNPLMYIEDDELIRIKGDKHAIGGQQRGDERIFSTHTLDLTDGKKRTFYLFSDGYQDQFGGEKGFKYLVGNFKKLLLSIHKKGVLDQKTILHEEIEEWKDGYGQTDDILVIGFKL